MIPFHRFVETGNELKYLKQALERGRISGEGPFGRWSMDHLSALLGVPVLLTTSCTHALELAALTLEIQPGDEVIVPSYTFPSSASAFALRGARITFADVSPDTFSMELPELEAALSEHTRAVIAVPYAGVWRDAHEIASLCESKGIHLIEDAAHALFASCRGQAYGTFGALAAFSFHQTKNVTSGEGGVLALKDERLFELAQMIREKGTDRSRFLRGEVEKYTWQVVGSNYMLSELQAAVLRAQLEDAQSRQRHRHKLWSCYQASLSPHAQALGFQLQAVPDLVQHSAHIFALLVPEWTTRGQVLEGLKARGVQATSHFEPLHLAGATKASFALPVTEALGERLIRLPLHAGLSLDEARVVAEALIHLLNDLC